MSDPIRIVELVGAPGSGKSTLVRWLSGREVRDPIGGGPRWIVPAHLLLQRPRPGLGGLSRALGRPAVIGLLARHRGLRTTLLIDPPGPAADPQRGTELPEGWDDLFRSAGAFEADDPRGDAEYRARARTWVLATHRALRAGLDAPEGLLPILDEGVVQRALTVLGSTTAADAVEAVQRLIAPGTLVIHLAVADELLVERALRRREQGDEPVLHRSLTPARIADTVRNDAAALSDVVAGLERRGARVLRVTDGSEQRRPTGPGPAGRKILRLLDRGHPAA